MEARYLPAYCFRLHRGRARIVRGLTGRPAKFGSPSQSAYGTLLGITLRYDSPTVLCGGNNYATIIVAINNFRIRRFELP